jgi:hypothetical protein
MPHITSSYAHIICIRDFASLAGIRFAAELLLRRRIGAPQCTCRRDGMGNA